MKCPKCNIEVSFNEKVCPACGADLEHFCQECGQKIDAGDSFCRHCGARLDESATTTSTSQASFENLFAQFQRYVPRDLAEQILATRGKIEGERRSVAVLFADVSNFTAMSEQLDAEEVTEIINQLFERLVECIYRYEGTVARYMGDCVMAFFGAPISHENDADRALLASMDILNAVKEINEILPVRLGITIGINVGTVVVGNVGTDMRMEYTAMGDVVNLAKRLQETAITGQILCSESIYEITIGSFNFRKLKPVKVKGKKRKVKIYQLMGAKDEPQELKGFSITRLVGRNKELSQLNQLVLQLEEGQGGVLEISGEAGLGKSRMKYELRQIIEDKRISFYQGHCPVYDTPIPYYPFVEILRDMLGIEDEDDEGQRKESLAEGINRISPQLEDYIPYISAIFSLRYDEVAKLTDEERQEQIFSSVLRLLESHIHKNGRPLILTYEDLQWADELTRELLGYLLENASTLPILFCCIYRPEFKPNWMRDKRFVLMPIGQLSHQEGLELIENLLSGGRLPEELSNRILEKAEGNPFYIEEMVRVLIDEGALVRGREGFKLQGGVSDITIPDTIQGIIMARLDKLEYQAKQTLQYASVIGRIFPRRVLEDISARREQLEEHLTALQRMELIFRRQILPEMEYIFKHFLTQEVAYNSILLKKRRQLHLKIAESIEKLYSDRLEEYYELLAYHYEKGENWMKAFQYFSRSGRKAEEVHTERQAEQFQQRGEESLNRYWLRFVLIAALLSICWSTFILGMCVPDTTHTDYQELLTKVPLPREVVYRTGILERISSAFSTIWKYRIFWYSLLLFASLLVTVIMFWTSVARTLNVWIQSPRSKLKWKTTLIIFVMTIASQAAFWGGVMCLSILDLWKVYHFEIGYNYEPTFWPFGHSWKHLVGHTLVWMFVGSLQWLIWSDRGWAGDLTSLGYRDLKNVRLQGKLALLGAIAGGIVFWIIYSIYGIYSREDIIWGFPFPEVLMLVAVSVPILIAAGFVIGNTFFAFCRPNIPLSTRLRRWMPGLIAGTATVALSLILYYGVMVGRYDWGRSLDDVTGISPATTMKSAKTILTFIGESEKPITEKAHWEWLDRSEIQKIKEYLSQRHYRTVLFIPTIMAVIVRIPHVWDVPYSLQTYLEMSKYPVYRYVYTATMLIDDDPMPYFSIFPKRLFDTLDICAASSENLAVLEELADESQFVYTAPTYRKMGDFYWRFGQREKSLDWYRKAGLSPAEIEELRTEKLPFTLGQIEGRIAIDGIPTGGIKVGVRLWEKLERLKQKRWPFQTFISVGTTTQQDGEFSLEYLVEGEYALAIKADVALLPADLQRIQIVNSPGKITVDEQSPVIQLGQIDIVTSD